MDLMCMETSNQGRVEESGQVLDRLEHYAEGRSRSLPHVALMNEFGKIVRTFFQKFFSTLQQA